MIIRKTRPEDILSVMEIYESAREFMRSTGNSEQWAGGYPPRELIEGDVRDGHSYVAVDDGEIIGTFFFKIGADPTYLRIDGGEWINNEKYGVIHRIAMKYQGRGIASKIYDYCYGIINNLRIDTHKDNLPMQHSLEKNGFSRRGIIYILGGDERIAYQKTE